MDNFFLFLILMGILSVFMKRDAAFRIAIVVFYGVKKIPVCSILCFFKEWYYWTLFLQIERWYYFSPQICWFLLICFIILNHLCIPETNFFFFFWLCLEACGILVPWPGIEPAPSAVEVWSPNHWTAREFPNKLYLIVMF